MKAKIIIFAFFMLLCASLARAQVSSFDWERLAVVWKQYMSDPTDNNAANVRAVLPKSGHVKYSNTFEEKETLKLIYHDLVKLEKLVLSEKQSAVQTAFSLMSISDGHMAEMLNIMLGKLIRENPALFLRELKRQKDKIQRLDALVGNFGEEYVDRLEAQCKEKNYRLEALMFVNDPDTREVNYQCIRILYVDIQNDCRSSGYLGMTKLQEELNLSELASGLMFIYSPIVLLSVFYIPFLVTSRFISNPSAVRLAFLNGVPIWIVYLWALIITLVTIENVKWMWHGKFPFSAILLIVIAATSGLILVLGINVLQFLLPKRLKTGTTPVLGIIAAIVTVYLDIFLVLLLSDAVRDWAFV